MSASGRWARGSAFAAVVVEQDGFSDAFQVLEDEPRVLLAAVLDTPRGPLSAGATHLSFVPGWNVRQLRHAVRALRALPAPRVLLGDLNMPSGPVRAFTGWRPLARAVTFPSMAPKAQLDHVLADPRGSAALVG